MNFPLIQLAVCWEAEKGAGTSEKLELRQENYPDGYQTDQVDNGYPRQRTVKTNSERKEITGSLQGISEIYYIQNLGYMKKSE